MSHDQDFLPFVLEFPFFTLEFKAQDYVPCFKVLQKLNIKRLLTKNSIYKLKNSMKMSNAAFN